MRLVLVWTLVGTASTACGPRPAPAPPSYEARPALELIGQYEIPSLTTFGPLEPARFGGISGLAIDPRTQELLGISDDSVDSRVFVFDPIALSSTPFKLQLHAYFPLAMGGAGAPAKLDPESIAVTRDGRLFITSEGIDNAHPRIPPAILEYTRRIEFVRELALPPKFLPPDTGPITRGARANASFESLTLSVDQRQLFTATETALVQDGEPADGTHGTLARLLEFEEVRSTFVARREFAYPIDPLGPLDFTPGFFINGLVELLAVTNTDFIALERGYAEEQGENGRRTNRIRLFEISLVGASDIARLESIRGRTDVQPVRKRLLLDLGSLPGLSRDLANLENFEGMTFGPSLPDGARTLLLVSDDNFSARQRTVFLLFRINAH